MYLSIILDIQIPIRYMPADRQYIVNTYSISSFISENLVRYSLINAFPIKLASITVVLPITMIQAINRISAGFDISAKVILLAP